MAEDKDVFGPLKDRRGGSQGGSAGAAGLLRPEREDRARGLWGGLLATAMAVSSQK